MIIAAANGPNAVAIGLSALFILVLLVGGFVWGSRRVSRRARPRPESGPARSRAGSWRTPDGGRQVPGDSAGRGPEPPGADRQTP
ncbi:hypothetical protein AB0K51_13145 [Kitasatospora sp. NPDC049285]|uniref:hypothetical protein n=1 Tax=Kitasatospora sp. NPDC049285 TaxID=3157096 RepID=UPI003436CE87